MSYNLILSDASLRMIENEKFQSMSQLKTGQNI